MTWIHSGYLESRRKSSKTMKNNEWSSFFKGILDSYYNQFRFIKSIYGLHFTFPVKYFFNFGKSAWLQVDSFSEPSSPTDFPFQNFKRTVLWFLLPFYLPKAPALTVLKKRKPEQSEENQILIFRAIIPAGPLLNQSFLMSIWIIRI